MKKVFITLSGKGEVFWMENFTPEFKEKVDTIDVDSDFYELEDKGVLDGDLNEIPFILKDVNVSWSYDDNSKSPMTITKKGKYIKTKEYLSSLFNEPFLVQHINGGEIESYFTIEIPDNEEFDPMKLQLVKSDYEVLFLPYGIIVSYIYYNGEKIYCDEHTMYDNKGGDVWIYGNYSKFDLRRVYLM